MTKKEKYMSKSVIIAETDVYKKVAQIILDKVIYHLKREKMSCLPCFSKEKDIPSVDVDVTVDVSGCNCCALTSQKKKKKKTNTVIEAPQVEQKEEVENTDKKVKRSSTTIIFISHDESKSEEK